jgi:hypothetical protein
VGEAHHGQLRVHPDARGEHGCVAEVEVLGAMDQETLGIDDPFGGIEAE